LQAIDEREDVNDEEGKWVG